MSNMSSPSSKRSLLDTAGSAFSITIAVIAAFTLQPFAQAATASHVAAFAAEHYGEWVVWLVSLVWWCATAGAIGSAALLLTKIILSGATVSALRRTIRI